jgi:hypothetical protein
MPARAGRTRSDGRASADASAAGACCGADPVPVLGAGVGMALAMLLVLAAPLSAVTTDPVSPLSTGTSVDIHCQNEPSSNVLIFFLASNTSHRFGPESSCPTLGFQQLSPLDGYYVEIDKTQLNGDEDTISLDDLRNDPGYVSEAHVQWEAPTPAPSPTSGADPPP